MVMGLSDTGIKCAREIQKNVSGNARQYGWTERMRTQRAILANTASSCMMASSAPDVLACCFARTCANSQVDLMSGRFQRRSETSSALMCRL